MVITNTEKGREAFGRIREKTFTKQFPLQYGIDSNYCLTHATKKPSKRDEIIKELSLNGYEKTAEKYFKCGFIHRLYWVIPPRARTLIRKLRGR